jgi:hypothetical protein
MPVSPSIQSVFGHFQNLNLLVLLQDLRLGRLARHAWQDGPLLCPVAHGLPAGDRVQELNVMGQAADVSEGCLHAARLLGADPDAVLRFVRFWDQEHINSNVLRRQLDEMWAERLADARAVQEFLQCASMASDQANESSAISDWPAHALTPSPTPRVPGEGSQRT